MTPTQEAAEREALPCPFCGSGNISDGEVLTSEGDGPNYVQSECQNCGALGPRAVLNDGEVDYGDVKSIAAWNRRATLRQQGGGAVAEPVAWLYTLEYGKEVAKTLVSKEQRNYPFGVCGADYCAKNDDGVSYVRQTPLCAAAPPAPPAPQEPFQARVQPWMMACFGPAISADVMERNHRFLEESLELVQSTGCTQSEAHQLVDYVYGRPAGDTPQEVGGVMVTLAALCLAHPGLDMHACGETELARIWTKVEQIRAKQAAKPAHSPLPEHTAPQEARESLTANMVWNADDAEKPHDSIESFLNSEICSGQPIEVGAEFTMLQAHKLPKVKIRVTSIDDESCEAEYEVIAATAKGERG